MAPAKGSKAIARKPSKEEAPVEPIEVAQHTEESPVKPCDLVQRLEDASVEPTEVGHHAEEAFFEPVETVQHVEGAPVEPLESVQPMEDASVETLETVQHTEDASVEFSTPNGGTTPRVEDAFVQPIATVQHMEAAPVEPLESVQPMEDASVEILETVQHTEDASVEFATKKDGITQKVKVYSMEMNDRVVEIVGSIGDKIVTIRATVYEMGSGSVGKVKQMSLTAQAAGALYLGKVGTTLKAKTVFLQDGYVYITSTVEGRVVYLKAKVAEPIKSCAISLHESSRKRIDPVLQKFKPFYVKSHDGITDLIGTIGERIVVIRTKMLDTSTSMKVWTVQSLSGARTVLEGYTSPVLNKAISLQQSAASRVDHILISIRDGAVHLKGAVGERTLPLRTTISKGWHAATRTPIALTGKLVEIVSNAYGKSCDKLKAIQCSIKDRCLYIFVQFKDRLVVIRISIAEFAEHVQSRSLELCAVTRSSIAGACSGAMMTILNATEITRTRALETGTNMRSLAVNPDARAAAAGGVALGASGAATGFITGGAVGAVCALPAAFFTFGLSIPVGAVVGAGAGGVLGGSAGTVAGSMAGYKAHREKETIGNSISGAFERAKAQKVKTVDSASNLRALLAARIRGHTGGSA